MNARIDRETCSRSSDYKQWAAKIWFIRQIQDRWTDKADKEQISRHTSICTNRSFHLSAFFFSFKTNTPRWFIKYMEFCMNNHTFPKTKVCKQLSDKVFKRASKCFCLVKLTLFSELNWPRRQSVSGRLNRLDRDYLRSEATQDHHFKKWNLWCVNTWKKSVSFLFHFLFLFTIFKPSEMCLII